MSDLREIIRQLRLVGLTNNVWGWSEIKRLPTVIDEDEKIERAVTGFYEGGHALVLATNKRITFLDAKIMSFRVEDVHYEMVSEVEHFTGIFMARLRIHCLSKQIELSSFAQQSVRDFAVHVDTRVNDMRSNLRTWEQMMEATNPELASTQTFRPKARTIYARAKRPFQAE